MAFLGLTCLGFAQENGVRFLESKSWAEVKAKAKLQSKYIFMDVYATWCGPCKEMDKSVYPSQNLGEYMNDKLISVKVQMDQSKNDAEVIKSWYLDAKQIINEYSVTILPTILVFSPEGKLINRSSGYMNENQLFKMVRESLEKKKPFYEKLEQFKKGKLTPSEMKDLVILARSFEEMEIAQMIADRYINDYLLKLSDQELFKKDNLKFIGDWLGNHTGKAFQLFTKQSERINAIIGNYQAQKVIMNFISKNYFPPTDTWKTKVPNWDSIETVVIPKFGALGKEKVYEQRMIYFMEIKDWKNYGRWYEKYLQKYLANTNYDPNYLSWALFEHVDDLNVLTFASDVVMKYALEEFDSNSFEAYDTFANLLYKIGRREEAIKWEERALKLSNNNQEIVKTLDKMKNNIKTWRESITDL